MRTGCTSNTKLQRRFIKIYFQSKGINNVNLINIFHNKLVKSKVPIYFQEQDPPLVSFQYTQNILGVCLITIKRCAASMLIIIILQPPHVIVIESSPFRYEPHGHVITGDLRIVKNRNLRRLLLKGAKYREQNTVDWKLNEKILTKGVDEYSKKWSKLEGYRVSALEEMSDIVKLIIKNRISNLQRRRFRVKPKIPRR